MHGGIGVTDELDIGLFLKRARVTALSFGDSDYHRDRFATLEGY
jgi:alkylation response protein AidB-like acyl-CoA dehydrogenase